MVEQVMIFALGFLIAGLIALAVAPAFWHRAIRLSRRRLEMQLPLSPQEILAAQDLLRAEFAVEQRRLEQNAEHLENLRAADRLELGRQTGLILEQKAALATLSAQDSQRGIEWTALERALAEAQAEFAAIAKESYDTNGLLGRKDAHIQDLTGRLSETEALAARQRETLAGLETDVARQSQMLAEQDATIERLEGEISTLNLQIQADQITLKTASTRIAEREEALDAAGKREKEHFRQRQLQAETTHAAEAGYAEKIERLRSGNADLQQALDAARREAEGVREKLAELREADPSKEAQMLLAQHEENEILREKIKEIGAAIVRAVGGSVETDPAEGCTKSNEPEEASPEKATA
ncbi:MAG: hypothetical protein FWC84_04535 [Alphaproteobacteria bacterium]|nr:hypothetical protein [Alphaproteobacteria bacterium]